METGSPEHHRAHDGPKTEGPVTLPWVEPGYREFKDVFATGAVLFLLALAAVSFVRMLNGAPGNQLGGAIMALCMAIVAAVIWYGPTGGVGARLTVDHDGLWIRHWGWRLRPSERRIELSIPKHIPAAQIGQAEIVTEDARSRMWRKSMALRYKGKRLGWTHNNVIRDTTEAVLLEQAEADLERPWWLLRSQNCEELIEALDLCRKSAK